MAGRSSAREVFVVYGAVLAACMAIGALSSVPFIAEHEQVAIGALFLVTALELAHRDAGGPERLGLGLGGLLAPSEAGPGAGAWLLDLGRAITRALPHAAREAGFALGVAALVFPPFALGYVLWFEPAASFALELPPDPLRVVAAQLLAVALPEEAFFRGYVQTRLTEAWPSTRRMLGASISIPALLAQAALFALVHVAFEPRIERLAVFFPALVFGWMRARRGGVGAAIVFHAGCNVYAEVLWLGFR
jgi:membrane protease YdiL (CAAX protease family)